MSGSNETIGGGGFHHVAIRSRNWDRSVDFYVNAMGFTERIRWGEPPKRAIMLDTGDGNYLEIFERPDERPVDGGGQIIHFAIRTRDIDAAMQRARDGGARVTVEPKDVTIPSTPEPTAVRLGFFQGPDGEEVELFQNQST